MMAETTAVSLPDLDPAPPNLAPRLDTAQALAAAVSWTDAAQAVRTMKETQTLPPHHPLWNYNLLTNSTARE